MPSVLVTAWRVVPVPVRRRVTLAPGTEEPEGSVTVPRISVDVVWEKATLWISSRNSETRKSFIGTSRGDHRFDLEL